MSNLKYFNQLVGKLNNDRLLQFGVYRKIFDDISRKIDLAKDDEILDLGAGCGELTKLLAEKCRRVVLADGAEKTVDYARNKFKAISNLSYALADITKLPLPFSDNQFNKVICYSVVHYATDLKNFTDLVKEMLRITRSGGAILVGDIPLSDKYRENLESRKKQPLKNYLLNLKYYLKKSIIALAHKISRVSTAEVKGISYTRQAIEEAMRAQTAIEYRLLAQDRNLPLSDSREDLLIRKL